MFGRTITLMFLWAALVVGVSLPGIAHAREAVGIELSTDACELSTTESSDHHSAPSPDGAADHASPHHHCNIDVARAGLPVNEPHAMREARLLPINARVLPSWALAPPTEPPAA